MATSTVVRAGRMPIMTTCGLLFSALFLALSVFAAAPAETFWMTDVPDWQSSSTMSLQLSAPGVNIISLNYELMPLTRNVGLQGDGTTRRVRWPPCA